MSTPGAATIRVALPDDFHLLPHAEQDVQESIAAIVESCGVGDRRRARLEAELLGAVEYAHARAAGRGRAWALIRNPATGAVDAVAMAEAHVRPDGFGPPEYLERCREAAKSLVAEDTWKLDASVRTIAGSEAVVLHQMEVPSGERRKPAIEQVMVAHFVSEANYVEYRLVTQDLGLFDDIVAFTTGVAAFAIRTEEDS